MFCQSVPPTLTGEERTPAGHLLWSLFLQSDETVVKKEPTAAPGNQWYDVGMVKSTSMLVTHYYVPLDNAPPQQTNGDNPSVSYTYYLLPTGLKHPHNEP